MHTFIFFNIFNLNGHICKFVEYTHTYIEETRRHKIQTDHIELIVSVYCFLLRGFKVFYCVRILHLSTCYN